MGAVAPVMAQHITRINPQNITLRAVSACGFTNVLTVGDSATVLIFRDSIHGWNQPNTHLDRSITLLAASYIDSLHGTIGGSKGTIAWTSDAGVTWQQSNSTTNGSIRSLAYNGASAVIGIGDSGVIIRSTDSGRTWSRIISVAHSQLNGVIFGTPNAGTIVGNDSIILRTTDAGQSWTRFINPYDLSQVAFLLDSINYVAVAMNGADSVWVTLRKPIFVMPFIRGRIDRSIPDISQNLCLDCGPATTLLLYGRAWKLPALLFGTDDYIYYQNNTGNHWYKNFVTVQGDADGNTDLLTSRVLGGTCIRRPHIGGAGEDILTYICGENGFFEYNGNGGVTNTWPLSSRSSLYYLSTSFTPFGTPDVLPSNVGYAVGTGGAVARTVDGGLSWLTLTIPGDTSENDTLNTVCKVDSSTAIVIGWNGKIQRTSDAGITWATLPSNTDERLHGIAFPTPSTGIIVGDNGTILRSTDTGKTWNSKDIVIDQSEQKFLYAVDFVDASTGVAAGEGGTMFRTTDAGIHWSAKDNIEHGLKDFRQIQACADGTIYARASTDLLVSHDAGQNWSYVFVQGGDTLGFGFYNSQIGIVGQRVTSSALVPDTAFFRYTTNGGAAWSNELAVPIWNYNRILFHWLNEHQVLLYGIQGFTVLLDITASGVQPTVLKNAPDFQVIPNPTIEEINLKYTTKSFGPVAIELWNATGKKIATLSSGAEEAGDHSRSFTLPKELHGAYFVRLSRDGGTSEQGIVIE